MSIREQKGATYYIEKVSGKKTKALLVETPGKNFALSMALILLAMSIAWVIWYLTMKQLGFWLLEIEAISDSSYKMPRLWITITVCSICVVYFNKVFKT